MLHLEEEGSEHTRVQMNWMGEMTQYLILRQGIVSYEYDFLTAF